LKTDGDDVHVADRDELRGGIEGSSCMRWRDCVYARRESCDEIITETIRRDAAR